MAKKYERDQPGLREHAEALNSLTKSLPQLAAAVGPDAFLRTRAVQIFQTAWLDAHPEGDVVTLRGTGETKPVRIADVTREFIGGSLFSKDKLIVVRQADRVFFPGASAETDAAPIGETAAKAGTQEKSFLERIDNPPAGAWLVLDLPALPKNRTLGKRLAEKASVVPCPQPTARDIPAFLRDRAREANRGLDHEAAELLLRAYGTDIGVLSGEIDKLALFSKDGEEIDAGMVREFLTGTVEFDIFAFTNAVEAKDAREAVRYARRITSQGARDQKGKREDGEKTAHKVMAIVAGNIAQLLRARVAMAKRTSPGDFAADEKVSPWRADKLYAAAARFELPELRRKTSFMADLVRSTHDTGGDVQLAVETAAVFLTRGRE